MLMSGIIFLWVGLLDIWVLKYLKTQKIIQQYWPCPTQWCGHHLYCGCKQAVLSPNSVNLNEWMSEPLRQATPDWTRFTMEQIRLRQLPANLPQSLESGMFAYKRHHHQQRTVGILTKKTHTKKNKRRSVLWSLMSVINLVHFSGCCSPAMMQDLQQLLQLTGMSRFWKLVDYIS